MTDARAATAALAALANSTPDARAATVALSALTAPTPDARCATVALMVLVPTAAAPTSTAFVGWGIHL